MDTGREHVRGLASAESNRQSERANEKERDAKRYAIESRADKTLASYTGATAGERSISELKRAEAEFSRKLSAAYSKVADGKTGINVTVSDDGVSIKTFSV